MVLMNWLMVGLGVFVFQPIVAAWFLIVFLAAISGMLNVGTSKAGRWWQSRKADRGS